MLDIRKRHTIARERLLAEAMKELAAELRLVEVADYVAFLRLERHANIADIVSSSAEPYFKPGVVRYADGGEIGLGWGTKPVIGLAMRFFHREVEAHFRLELAASSAAVDITYIDFPGADVDTETGTRVFERALADARLVPALS